MLLYPLNLIQGASWMGEVSGPPGLAGLLLPRAGTRAAALFSRNLSKDIYAIFQKPGLQMVVIAAVLLAAYLARCCVRAEPAGKDGPREL